MASDRELIARPDSMACGTIKPRCPRMDNCPLYASLELTAEAWRQMYCEDELRYPDCARLRLFLQGKPVPLDLLPNGQRR